MHQNHAMSGSAHNWPHSIWPILLLMPIRKQTDVFHQNSLQKYDFAFLFVNASAKRQSSDITLHAVAIEKQNYTTSTNSRIDSFD